MDQKRPAWWRRLWPWAVGIAIVVVIATQVPFAKFSESISQGPHLTLAAVELLLTLVVLVTDSFGTWVGLVAARIRWPFARVTAVRGATYLLSIVNYAAGQGGFGYYLYRAGESALRAAGITLFLLGTNLAALLLLTFVVWGAVAGFTGNDEVGWTAAIGVGGFAVYLVVIAVRIRFLSERQLLSPLFEAGVGGHVLAVVGRLPHVVMIVLAHWIAMLVWGIDVPFEVAATLMPAVALASVLPISPAGLGTTQAAMVYFFAVYAPGATEDDRVANLLAFGIVHFVYSVGGAVLVGLVCLIFARRSRLLADEPRQAV